MEVAMSNMIQPLESRVLFSSIASIVSFVADGTQLATDIGTARADASQYLTTLGRDVRTTTADVRTVPASARKQALLRPLRIDEAKWSAAIRGDVRSVAIAATTDGHRTVSDAILVFRHPTNLTFIARLTGDLAVVGGKLDAPAAKLQADVSAGRAALVGDLNNIASANPTDAPLQTDVSQISADSQSAISQLTTDGQTIQSDLKSLAQALGG
jgi:hypothetical protein